MKSDNLQYDKMVCWFAGTNDLSDFQVYFFHNFFQNLSKQTSKPAYHIVDCWIFNTRTRADIVGGSKKVQNYAEVIYGWSGWESS